MFTHVKISSHNSNHNLSIYSISQNNMNTSLLFSLLILFSFSCFPNFTTSTSRILALVEPNPTILKYHNGDLLKGNITVNLIWYGKFTATQKSIIVDFLNSFNRRVPLPLSVASWWSTTSKYKGGQRSIFVNKQITDQTYSLGKSLKNDQIMSLATKYGYGPNSINVVLTSADVAVEGFCMNRCGTHGNIKKSGKEAIYVWVGNSATQCPGQCAWPFAKPTFGPQTKPLVAPNKDVGIDGMIINLATLLAGTVTNPSDGGYYQGPATAPLEAVSACTGIFGSGAFPGYPGKVLVDKVSGGTYNARGGKGKYLLPAMWDPTTSKCKPIV